MLRLAIPVVISYLGIMLMGMVDLLFIGRVGAAQMGAVGVGLSFFSWFLIFGIGLLGGLDYIASFAFGAGKPEEGRRAWKQSLWIAIAVGIAGSFALLQLAERLDVFGINPEVTLYARPYLKILALSLTPLYVFTTCRQYLQAQGSARPIMIVLIAANVVNALLNWTLVWGNWGFPRLETDGSAWATTFSRAFMMLASLLIIGVVDKGALKEFKKKLFDFELIRKLLKLGIPSALQMTFEVGAFAVATTLAARLSAVDLAAHQIVLNMASLTFMVPLGIGTATSVLVGQAMGSHHFAEVKRAGRVGLISGCAFMLFSCVVMLGFPTPLLAIYTTDPAVIATGSTLLLIAGLFQLTDGAQVVITGALRGIGDTRTAAIANLGGHWFVGLPLGIFLTFHLGMGLRGLWLGLSAGLLCVSVGLLVAWTRMSSASRLKLR